TLLVPNVHWNWKPYGEAIKRELSSFGFEVSFEEKEKKSQTAVKSAFLKTPTVQELVKIGVYHPLVENSHFDCAKAPGLNDRKMGSINSIQPILRSFNRGSFRASQNGNFQLEGGIHSNLLKGVHHESMIRIKVEIDTEPTVDYGYEQKFLSLPLA